MLLKDSFKSHQNMIKITPMNLFNSISIVIFHFILIEIDGFI